VGAIVGSDGSYMFDFFFIYMWPWGLNSGPIP
jgi:hypothetical protein